MLGAVAQILGKVALKRCGDNVSYRAPATMYIRPYFPVLYNNYVGQHNCGAHRAAISPADIAASSLYRVSSVVPERSFDVSCLRLYPVFAVAAAM